MVIHPAYVVLAQSAAELETVRARTSGVAILYHGDALGKAWRAATRLVVRCDVGYGGAVPGALCPALLEFPSLT